MIDWHVDASYQYIIEALFRELCLFYTKIQKFIHFFIHFTNRVRYNTNIKYFLEN